MSGKTSTRVRLQIDAMRAPIQKQDEHLLCSTTNCRNVIAVWSLRRDQKPVCSRCRHG